ncbi:MAG: polysaccharide deacetylase family protein, partial [bacterium]|nr:polysaccharide deacetylase family protein [bacterium]
DNPFFWDLAAFCFHHTASDHVLFPNAKERSWTNAIEKTIVGNAWIESMKSLSNVEKQIWVNRLPEQLRVSIPENYFKNMMMNWDQVREMSRNGIGFGGHTMSHPILNQIPLDQAFTEIKGSKERIEKELGEKILSFAYPNGMSNNFNSDIELITSKAGYRAAFTLLNGPTLLREVKGNPYAIRRIFISHTHTLSNFAALTSYINRYRK